MTLKAKIGGTFQNLGGSTLVIGQPNLAGGTTVAMPGVVPNAINAAFVLVANQQYNLPFVVETAITVDAITCSIATAIAASVIRLGIYEANTNWQPGTLIKDAGTVDSSSGGTKTASFTAIILPAGRYVVTGASSHAPTMRGIRGQVPFGKVNSDMSTNNLLSTGYMKAGVGSGALANPGVAWDAITFSTTAIEYFAFLRITAV